MRPLLLIFLTFAVMIGLPRLADRFRGGQPRVDSQAASVAHAQPEMLEAAAPNASPRAFPAAQTVPPLSVPLQASPVHPRVHAASNSESFTERDLILAIEKELIRVDYYDGPAAGRWTKRVRLAARHFVRRTGGTTGLYPSPTVSLLDSLKKASAGKNETSEARLAAMQALPKPNVENPRSRKIRPPDYLPVSREGKSYQTDRLNPVLEDDRRAARVKHVHHRTRRQTRIRGRRREAAWRSQRSFIIPGF
jgi:hypothetical protein